MRNEKWKHVRIGKEYNFSASHQLLNTGVPDHPCSRLHGHNYRLVVECRGEIQPKYGWIVDFAYIDECIKPLIEKLDHHHLNDIEGLSNPTAENLAQWIMDNHTPHFLFSVTVWETPKCYATVVNGDGLYKRKDLIE